MKKILITGANSFIGTNFESFAHEFHGSEILTDTLDLTKANWREKNFSGYDCVFHVAGLAHVNINKADEATKRHYYEINTDLAVETALKAKTEGVKQFIFMSSMIIYGNSERITRATEPSPINFYGDSKLQADLKIQELNDENFLTAVLRPPFVYGKGCKGNYKTLSRLAKLLPMFPEIHNQRSLIYIDNLCEFICQIILREKNGVFWPQNSEYASTSEILKEISEVTGHKIIVSKCFNWLVSVAKHIPGKIQNLTLKAFSSMTYDKEMSVCDFEYCVTDFKTSIIKTEL